MGGVKQSRRDEIPASAEVPSGVALSRTSLGGVAVSYKGTFLGWIHGRNDTWRAYLRTGPLTLGTPLGEFTRVEAIGQILAASGRCDGQSSTSADFLGER
ncbi:hypothetical protein SAMN06264365_111166 [Actinoplanes regularis]|uniref:Uncharacterized protein n=1 Tax=Actinoplanes regularis TaxID=52697 RepID=A0A239CHD1_9ACTN|nr:hypothetical protein Are01nite_58830 [Actinoplanes regularis]SNS19081.1 hypothetical protein SAMN06264365_111166 [Actinoplanes regularis]